MGSRYSSDPDVTLSLTLPRLSSTCRFKMCQLFLQICLMSSRRNILVLHNDVKYIFIYQRRTTELKIWKIQIQCLPTVNVGSLANIPS